MRKLLLGIFFGCVLTSQAQDWGPAENGLRIAVSVANEDSKLGPEILFHFQNAGLVDLLVPVGVKLAQAHPLSMRPFLRTGNGPPRRIIYTAVGAVAGYMELWNLPLRPGESYTLRSPASSWFVMDGDEKLTSALQKGGQFWVELEQNSPQCAIPNKLIPMPCWHGNAVSETIRLPR